MRAAVSIAGPGALFTRRFFAAARVPFLMIAGTDDLIVDYGANAPPILERAPRAALLTLAGGSHVGFAGGLPWFVDLWSHPDTLGCRELLRRLPQDVEGTSPFAPLGGPDQGILLDAGGPPPCSRGPGALAMRPRRQQIVLRLGVRAFLDAELGATPEEPARPGPTSRRPCPASSATRASRPTGWRSREDARGGRRLTPRVARRLLWLGALLLVPVHHFKKLIRLPMHCLVAE